MKVVIDLDKYTVTENGVTYSVDAYEILQITLALNKALTRSIEKRGVSK